MHALTQPILQSTFVKTGLMRNQQILVQLFPDSFVVSQNEKSVSIELEQVKAFSYATVSNYLNGMAQGNVYHLDFWMVDNSDERPLQFTLFQPPLKIEHNNVFGIPMPFRVPLNYALVNQDRDDTVEELCSRLTAKIASTLIEQFNRESAVPWTTGICLTQQGVEFTSRKGIATRFDYVEFERFDFADAVLNIKTSSSSLPQLSIGTATRNFFPGFTLFKEVLCFRGII